ncbi:MAG: hypothetical protein ACXWW5_01410 [Actinomycetota bacterium]
MADEQGPGWQTVIEIAEVAVLAIVAIATAWSGYQATQWGGRQAVLYGQASSDRFRADAASTLGGQQLVADSAIFTAWLEAQQNGDKELEALLVRRFSPDYRQAFHEWLAMDPFEDPLAPPGPGYVPGFTNPNLEEAKRLNAQASVSFADGTEAREIANKYVRDTVLFASVLFFVAIAQRFTVRGVRIGANALALVLLLYTLSTLVTLPRV